MLSAKKNMLNNLKNTYFINLDIAATAAVGGVRSSRHHILMVVVAVVGIIFFLAAAIAGRSRGSLPGLASSHTWMSSLLYKNMSSERGRGSEGCPRKALAPSPVAPIRYQGYWLGSSTCWHLSTPYSDFKLGDAKTPHAISPPISSSYQGYPRKGCPAFVAPVRRIMWIRIGLGE